MLTPTIVLLFMFCYMPIYGIVIAFQNYKIGDPILSLTGGTTWVGLKNFIDFFKSIFFKQVVGNTLRLSIKTLLISFWVPVVFAVIINEIRIGLYKRVSQTFVYLPYFVSVVVVVSMLMTMTSQEGFIGKIVEVLNGGRYRNIMDSSSAFDWLYIGSNIWQTFGYNSIIYMAAIAAIDPTLYEQATVDGANRLHKIIRITIPCILPTITILLILAVGGMLGSYTEKILLMINPNIMPRAQVIGTYIYEVGLKSNRYSYAASVGIFTNIINFGLVFGANAISRKISDTSLW